MAIGSNMGVGTAQMLLHRNSSVSNSHQDILVDLYPPTFLSGEDGLVPWRSRSPVIDSLILRFLASCSQIPSKAIFKATRFWVLLPIVRVLFLFLFLGVDVYSALMLGLYVLLGKRQMMQLK